MSVTGPQADQTHQAAAGGERGAALHQSAADPQGDDDQRPRLRRKGREEV